MEIKGIRYFLDTAGALLAAITIAVLIGIHTSIGYELPYDPIFQISLRTLYWVFAGLVFCVALVCLVSQKAKLKAALVLWVTLNVVVYAIGIQWGKPNETFSACLSFMSDAFDLTASTTLWLAKAMGLYLLIGCSAVLLFGKRSAASPNKLELAEFKKMACPACDGHIEFPVHGLGQTIACPHCTTPITIQNKTMTS